MMSLRPPVAKNAERDTRWKGQETISLFAKNDHEIEDLQNLARGVLECDLNPPIVKPSIADVVELSGS
jgi:hypothetical protein